MKENKRKLLTSSLVLVRIIKQKKRKGEKMKADLEKGIALIQLWREDTAEEPKSREQEMWLFMFDNYVAFKNGELTQGQIDRLNKIDPNWINLVENEIINTYREAIGA